MPDAHPAHLPPIGEGDPAKGSQVRAMFDAIAPRYDLLNAACSASASTAAGAGRRWPGPRRTRPRAVLDVATGTADLAIALRRAAPAAAWWASTSPSAMLASGGPRRRGGVELRLEVADGTALPFADGSFDAVTIAYGLRNFGDIDAGLREFRRVLRRGGRLVVLEFPPPPGGPFGRLFRAYFARVVPWLGGLVSGRPRGVRLPAGLGDGVPRARGAGRPPARAGFRDVRYRLQTWGVSALHRGDVP
jgi:demethylmenaquinone methyltransferase / 2-methoxy-6-polyprenyl-1,4-benzoquinol methylase